MWLSRTCRCPVAGVQTCPGVLVRRVYFPIGTCPRKEGAAEKARAKGKEAREGVTEAKEAKETRGGEGGVEEEWRSSGRFGGRDTVATVCSGGLV